MINPELFEKVERSLRKRLHTDVRLLLLRCAARSSDDDEFLIAASRLLADVIERRRWLATWPKNDPAHRADTDSSLLPEPVPYESDIAMADGNENWDSEDDDDEFEEPAVSPEQVEGLKAALAQEVGPIATFLVEKESAQSKSVADLRDRLLSHLETESERLRFHRVTQRWVDASSSE